VRFKLPSKIVEIATPRASGLRVVRVLERLQRELDRSRRVAPIRRRRARPRLVRASIDCLVRADRSGGFLT
jgi:hypothetical protein